ncbi:MAG: PAS domain S-box protein [Alphaproteobacteria bacterium]|nr:PAS domain S-box protein [Alphaproteobacteria bacterium]
MQRFDTATYISSAADQDIAEHIGMLRALSSSDDLIRNQFDKFANQAGTLVAQPRVRRIWAFSQDGKTVAGTKAEPVEDTTLLQRAFIERVFNGSTSISQVYGTGIEDATAVITVPVYDRQSVIYGLAAEVSVGQLSRLFFDVGLDPDWPAAVVDQSGRFVARSIDPEKLVGEMARPELVAAARGSENSGTFENTTWENVEVLNAYHRSDLTGWTSVVAVPKTELIAPLQRAVILTVLGAAAILTVTIMVASVMAQRISEPVRDLSRYAAALADGRPVDEIAYDIIELDDVRSALEAAMAKNARLAALVASSGDAILSMNLDGTIATWNEGAEKLFGYTAEEIVGKPKSLIVPVGILADFEEQKSKVLQGEWIRTETVRRRKDGKLIDVSVNAAPIRRADGRIIAISSVIHDISERKADEAHRHLLMRELAHRSKNQLAIIQSIASQTARSSDSMDEFLADFRQRLRGISISHDLLTGQDWRGASLTELVHRQLAVFVGENGDNGETSHISDDSARVTVLGPDVLLESSAAEAIGLALHELATNSVKYGSLSVPGGSVSVRWRLSSNGSTPQKLSLEWVEKDGPPITEQPSRKGFGSRIIETLVASAVSGRSNIEYRPEGAYWRLDCDLPAAGS